LALGIFAFGLKKKTEINNTYLILSYVQNNVPIDCIFKNAVNNQQLGNIISTLFQFLIGSLKTNMTLCYYPPILGFNSL